MSLANRLARRRRRIDIHPDGIQVGIDGCQRAVLTVGGVYHDTQSDDERDQTAAALDALVAGLVPTQEVHLLVQSNPLDRDQLLAQVAADTHDAVCPPELRPYRDGNRAWWAEELGNRHQARRDFYVIVSPLPGRHASGSPGERAALEAAVRAVVRHLAHMGVDTARLDGPAVAALLASNLPAEPRHGPGGVVTVEVPDLSGRERRDHVVLPDGTLARTMYLLAPPRETDPGWVQPLVSAEVPYTLAMTLRGLDQERERKRAARRDRYLQDQVSFSRHVTTDVEEAQRGP